MICRRQNAAFCLDRSYVLFLGSVLIGIIFRGNLKIAVVLGVVCIRVKGFFFRLLFLFLLDKEIETAASRQCNQRNDTEKACSALAVASFSAV